MVPFPRGEKSSAWCTGSWEAQAFGTEQAAKSGSLAKLAIGDDVRLVSKTAVVIRAE